MKRDSEFQAVERATQNKLMTIVFFGFFFGQVGSTARLTNVSTTRMVRGIVLPGSEKERDRARFRLSHCSNPPRFNTSSLLISLSRPLHGPTQWFPQRKKRRGKFDKKQRGES